MNSVADIYSNSTTVAKRAQRVSLLDKRAKGCQDAMMPGCQDTPVRNLSPAEVKL